MRPGDRVYYRYEIKSLIFKGLTIVPLKAVIIKESKTSEFDWVIEFEDPLLFGVEREVYDSDLSLIQESNDIMKDLCSK